MDTQSVSNSQNKSATQILANAQLHFLDRGLVYGDAAINHRRIASLWGTFLDIPITADDVAMCMALVKIARIMETRSHIDSYEDAAAYLAIAGSIAGINYDELDRY